MHATQDVPPIEQTPVLKRKHELDAASGASTVKVAKTAKANEKACQQLPLFSR